MYVNGDESKRGPGNSLIGKCALFHLRVSLCSSIPAKLRYRPPLVPDAAQKIDGLLHRTIAVQTREREMKQLGVICLNT